MAYRRYGLRRRFKRRPFRPYRPTRAYRRRRISRRVRRSEVYTRWYCITQTFATQKTDDSNYRITADANALNGHSSFGGEFEKYRMKRYSMTVRPASNMDAAQFSFVSDAPNIWTAFDPFERFSTTNEIGFSNGAYSKRHSLRFVRRKGIPHVLETRTAGDSSGGTYAKSVSPWIKCGDNDIAHYITSMWIPAINAPDAVQPMRYHMTLWVQCQYAGKR